MVFNPTRDDGRPTPHPVPESDEALARQAAADPEAFAELYRRYLPRVYAYCWTRLDGREADEDATSQVWLNAYAALPRFRADNLRAWLFTIAHHVVTDIHRQRGRGTTVALDDEAVDPARGPEHEALAAQTGAELRRAVRLLPADQQRVIELRLAGLTGPEIRVVLGRGRSWVDTTQHRAVVRLRQLLPDAASAKEPTDATT